MTMRLLFVLGAIAAGMASTYQAAINGALSTRTGLGGALVINAIVVLASALAFLLLRGGQATFFPAGTPWFLYVGGVCGFFIILVAAFILPKIGAGTAVSLMVLGQGAAALLIDHFGLLGLERQPLTLPRFGGMALILLGVALLRR